MDTREIEYLVDAGRAHLDWQRLTCRWANTERTEHPDKCIVTHRFFVGCGSDPTMRDHGT